ncbi:GTPase-activating protein GYP7 [Aspergillus saccharolyticus JOP 1030-1]|uniref:GTPase-activating protein GYP7 n=1 Tax=Aspergillus saccharolyticus JOP 1030-1 TaxID=1450539 RepID=A0A318ZVQ6_9EURO|nr:GTPase-activating protein Gyp7 [Aspergillus saccharolyticus JOP 1030-1]PYH48150.1 GTPase-activating protein Gyp7 [Aspergillus saccharolyticus JOP 1030-1]
MADNRVKYTTPPSPPSPTASYYDVSDDEEDDYNTISHSTSRRGVKLLFSKSKVYVHPTPSSKDNIPGFIALVQQKPLPHVSGTSTASSTKDISSYLLAWVPESSLGDAYSTYVKVDLSDDASPPRQKYLVPALPTTTTYKDPIGLYAFAVPLSEIYSLLVRPPSLGWWFGSLVINSRAGDSFPALFFHDTECESTILQKKKRTRESFDPFGEDGSVFWGGDEVLRWLRKYVEVQRSALDSSVYLINPSEEDRVSFGQQPTSDAARGSQDQALAPAQPGGSRQPDAGMDPFVKTLKEARWKVLESLSKITTFTRRTANELADNPRIPPQVRRLMRTPEIQTLQDEFDSARLYLARWAMSISEQSERERNQRIWTARDVLGMENSSVGDFEILELETGTMSIQERRKTVTLKEWEGFFDPHTGRLQVTVEEVKERVFHGGLDPNDGVRKEAWLFLLGVYPWDSSRDERQALISSKRDEYIRLKGAWWEKMVEGSSTAEEYDWWKEQRNRIEKDVHRTDRTIPLFAGEDIPHPDPDSPFAETGTNVHLEQMKDMLLTYNEYSPDLGYVQGMSDLLAPIYAVMQDDAVAFWAFAGFMDRMVLSSLLYSRPYINSPNQEQNFLRDQSGMRAQLTTLDHLVQLMDPQLYLHLQSADSTNFFFFFRMLLVWYKREFEWVDVLRLWETLWTDYLSSSFHLFIALAILEKHRDVIMDHLKQFDEVLKYINELSNTMELIPILTRAESLFHRFERAVQAIDKKNNFPSPSPTTYQRKPNASTAENNNKGKSPERPSQSTGFSTGSSATPGPSNGPGDKDAKVISPELRQLFAKDIPWARKPQQKLKPAPQQQEAAVEASEQHS